MPPPTNLDIFEDARHFSGSMYYSVSGGPGIVPAHSGGNSSPSRRSVNVRTKAVLEKTLAMAHSVLLLEEAHTLAPTSSPQKINKITATTPVMPAVTSAAVNVTDNIYLRQLYK